MVVFNVPPKLILLSKPHSAMITVESSLAFVSSSISPGIDSLHLELSSRLKGCRLAGLLASAAAIACAAAPVSHAATIDWKSAPTNTTWATGSNWDGGIAPANSLTTDIARFNGTSYTFQPDAGTTSIAGIEIGNGTTATVALTLSGTNLSIGASGITKFANSGTAAISSNVTLGAAQSWTNNSSTLLTVSGNVTNAGYLLTIGGSGNTTLSTGVVSGTGGITKSGNGTLSMTGSNSYGGATTVSSGILNIQNGSALGTTVGGTSVAVGATLQLEGGISVGNETLSILGFGATGQNGALVNVSGTNSYGGQLTMANNVAGNAISSDSGTLNLTNTGTIANSSSRSLFLTGSGNGSLAGVLTAGAISKNGTGTWMLTGASTYNGSTTVNSGILNIQNGSALGTTVLGTSLALGTTLQLEGGISVGNETLSIFGLGAAGQNGALVNVSGTNSYGGQLTLLNNAAGNAISSDSGTLNLTNTGTIINGNSRTLFLNGSGNGSLAGVLALGAITKNGTGTWTLTGANTYTGSTTINVGRLQLGDGNSTGSLSASSAIVNNANLTINRSNAVAQGTDFSTAAITGTGSFTQAGTGTTTLNATNSYTGVTTVERGTLSFTSGAASATANQALGANATVILGVASTSSGTLNYTGAAGILAKNVNVLGNGSDTIQNNGTGLLTLSGNVTKNGTTLTLKGGSHGINVTGAISGSNANSDLIIDGGTTTLTNANNTYNGPTFIINGATLNASVVGALPTSTLSAVTINGTGSTLALGASQSVASLSGTSGASVNLNANTLTINGSSTTTYSGGISGTGNLVKNGSGTTTLNAANTYTGTTTVNSGTLAAAATNALGNSTVIYVTGGSFLVTAANAVNDNANINLGGTLALNGTFNETVGLLTLSANSVIDLDGFTGILRFGGVGSWASNTTLAIWNWNGINGASNRHVVFTNNSTLTSNLANISFYSDSGNSFVGNGFGKDFMGPGGGTEIIAVPEPEAFLYAVVLLAGVAVQYLRRRFKQKFCRLSLTSDPRPNCSATTVAVTITADAHPLA